MPACPHSPTRSATPSARRLFRQLAARVTLSVLALATLGAGAAESPGAVRVFSQEWGRVIPLDGEWEIADGARDHAPGEFPARVPVPGLVTNARPAFPDVGVEGRHEAFWYRRTFTIAGDIPPVARLKIGKAMFGTKVFVNGHEVGESPLSFVPLYFRVERFLRGGGAVNEIVVRVGAHLSALPDDVVTGSDAERHRYPPGIYDRVQLLLSSDPWVDCVQVAPRVGTRSIEVAVEVAGAAEAKPVSGLTARVLTWPEGRVLASADVPAIVRDATGRGTARFVVPVPEARLWSPEEPALHVLEITDGRDRYVTRFGMREFRLDPAFTNRALLNGVPCFVRGTNLGVHRFFEDEACAQFPWDADWVRRLIRRFTAAGMNGARITLGPAPELWYEIADEEGFMIFDEYAIWYAYQPEVGDVSEQAADPYRKWAIWPKRLGTAQLIREYTAWMRERWNHACIVAWDAQNETWTRATGEAIDAVRGLDLSGRPWDNGWSPPRAPGDMREAHSYFERWVTGTEMLAARERGETPFTLSQLARAERLPSTFFRAYQSTYRLPTDWHWTQPCIINEYAYLWLHRDGSPTELTRAYYDAVLGPGATADARREHYARMLAAVTEYWRATRSVFGVLYPFGLAGSIPQGCTNDNFIDIPSLAWDRHFQKFVPDAFAPVGICAELWQDQFKLRPWWGVQAEFAVAVINDTGDRLADAFEVCVIQGEAVVSRQSFAYEVEPFGLARRWLRIDLPEQAGHYEIVASVRGRDGRVVRSWRRITLAE